MRLSIDSLSLDVNDHRVYALLSGQGPAIMLFHASPMNSASLIPLINLLSDTHTVIAVDTPGYGRSDVPSQQPTDLTFYADVVDNLREQLNLDKMAIYGTATGAQIGVRYALDYPDHVEHIFLDNVAHFSSDMAEQVMDDYFPNLTPRIDGSHLPVLWDNVVNLFKYFPWCWKHDDYRLSSPLPSVDILHKVAVLYLQAGGTYDWAYRAAFEHERREYIAQLQVPTTIFRWDLSIVKKFTDQIFEIDLTSHVDEVRITAAEDRYEKIAQTITLTYRPAKFKSPISSSLSRSRQTRDVASHTGDDMLDRHITPELSGNYLLESWKRCRQINPTIQLEKLNHTFINWISKA